MKEFSVAQEKAEKYQFRRFEALVERKAIQDRRAKERPLVGVLKPEEFATEEAARAVQERIWLKVSQGVYGYQPSPSLNQQVSVLRKDISRVKDFRDFYAKNVGEKTELINTLDALSSHIKQTKDLIVMLQKETQVIRHLQSLYPPLWSSADPFDVYDDIADFLENPDIKKIRPMFTSRPPDLYSLFL
jgi:hypothetical protein